MAKETKANDPAFSKSAFYHPDGSYDLPENGLTKREYFAGIAMQGLLADTANTGDIYFIVRDAINLADALIEELNK